MTPPAAVAPEPTAAGAGTLWEVATITTSGHRLHPLYTVRSVECCEDPDDGLPPMPYQLFVEGLCREEAERICAELNRAQADPRAMVEPQHLVRGGRDAASR